MKRAFFFLSICLIAVSAMAQNTPLIVQLDNQNKPYLTHIIGPKENFYSIGRIYNISPRVFAPYNGLELTSTLAIGQQSRGQSVTLEAGKNLPVKGKFDRPVPINTAPGWQAETVIRHGQASAEFGASQCCAGW